MIASVYKLLGAIKHHLNEDSALQDIPCLIYCLTLQVARCDDIVNIDVVFDNLFIY